MRARARVRSAEAAETSGPRPPISSARPPRDSANFALRFPARFQENLGPEKANYRPPALASRAGGPPGPMRAIDVFDQLVENPCLRQGDALDRHRRRLPMDLLTLVEKLGNAC